MITGIAIENFKGVRERIDVQLRPITLLFGANSAGKSTILHALHYARELFERHNLDAAETISGGKFIDLGGFQQMVHRSSSIESPLSAREITLRIEHKRSWSDQPNEPNYDRISQYLEMELLSLLFWPSDEDTKWAVEVTISWSQLENQPYVRKLEVELDGESFATIVASANLKEVHLEPNLRHKSLLRMEEWEGEGGFSGSHDPEGQTVLEAVLEYCGDVISPGDGKRLDLSGSGDALPTSFDSLDFVFEQVAVAPLPKNATKEQQNKHHEESVELISKLKVAAEVTAGLEMLVMAPCQAILRSLKSLRYLGPLRETPARNHQPPKFNDPSRWASGLGAWDSLQSGSNQLISSVSDWLSEGDRLNSGYSLERRIFKEIDIDDPLMRKIIAKRLFDDVDDDEWIDIDKYPTNSQVVIVPQNTGLQLRPHDVGIGISQVVPVVVTCVDSDHRILAIEQPELHLHPKLQAELADLFIESALGDRKHQVILETHSELIPLRIMRRIRETAEDNLENGIPPVASNDVGIYYVETYQSASVLTQLELGERGQLLDPWPEGFFEEGFRERFSDGE